MTNFFCFVKILVATLEKILHLGTNIGVEVSKKQRQKNHPGKEYLIFALICTSFLGILAEGLCLCHCT